MYLQHMHLRIALFLALLTPVFLTAQGELNATVRVLSPQLQRTDRKVMDQLEIGLRDWLNNTKWTKDAFNPEERIKCTFLMTIATEGENNSFTANLSVQATRPVFGSNYDTPIFAYMDEDFNFLYEQNQQIDFIPDNSENPNLAAVFAFYVYIILGMDYDSFSPYGGETFFQNAQQIVVDVQNSTTNRTPGWRPASSDKNRSRYWLAENMVSPRLRGLRQMFYNYHRLGLDKMSSNMDEGRNAVANALEEVEKANLAYLNAMAIQLFSQVKRDEIVEMMKNAPLPQRQRIFQIMTKVDPTNAPRYREMGVQ
jgi:Domain of unknown function (DUF4835)